MSQALILVGHGSRRSRGNHPILALAERFAARVDLPVHAGFLELATPSVLDAIDAAVADGAQDITLAPAVLLAAGHAKNDLPQVLATARKRHPECTFRGSRPLGVTTGMVRLLCAQVEQARSELPPCDNHAVGVVFLGRGSSDPDANSDVYKLGRMLSERQGFAGLEVGFVGVTEPTLEQALKRVLTHRPKQVVVVPHLLYPGVLAGRVRDQVEMLAKLYPRVRMACSAPLGSRTELLDLLLERVVEAQEGTGGSSCDGCKYRAPLPGFEHEVGGIQAQRKAKAHLEIPSDPSVKPHAHTPPRSHVLVCVNRDCVDRGSLAALSRFRQRIRADGKRKQIQTTRVMCMGRCGEGPAVCVYPEGVWYRGVSPEDADEIYDQHLLGNRPVGRLIDQVLGGV
ncbi:MAG: sirohydrochlorin cobaltochelatase [Cognaticolwellia sp.]|jgi:sirohydrochlorin cobaltochelatase